jgi:L-fucose isomerase-like protein
MPQRLTSDLIAGDRANETRADARRYSNLFSKTRDKIDGVIVTLPDFGDERSVVEFLNKYLGGEIARYDQ